MYTVERGQKVQVVGGNNSATNFREVLKRSIVDSNTLPPVEMVLMPGGGEGLGGGGYYMGVTL